MKSVSSELKFAMYRKWPPTDGRASMLKEIGASGLQRSDSELNATVTSLPVDRNFASAASSVPTTGTPTLYTSMRSVGLNTGTLLLNA